MKKELSYSQKVAIELKRKEIMEKQQEFFLLLNEIAREHGIPEQEFPLWRLNDRGDALEKIDIPENKEE